MSADTNRDFYEVLGVDRNADARTIKRAFLKKARTLHPDVSDDPAAEAKFKEVNEAYSVLSDERKRANYDQYGNPDGPAGFGGDYVDMSDIFSGFGGMGDIFDSFFGGSGGRSGSSAARTAGRDMGITLRLTLAEAAAGCKKTIAYDRLAPCDDCGGTGTAEGGSVVECEHCHGRGVVTTVRRTVLGQMQSQAVCPECGGSGHKVDKPCETCDGQGRTPSRETVEVNVPAGVMSGQELRVDGYGEAGVRGDRAGDLVVRIEVLADEIFQRQGDELACSQQVSAFEAMLGCTLHIDGILADEKVDVEVPAGCQPGQVVRVSGHGMPSLRTGVRGDLHVVIDVHVPDDLTDEQRETLAAICKERGERHDG